MVDRQSRPVGTQSSVSALCGFVRAKACFLTLQVVVLVLCAQAMLRYSGGAASPGARGPGGLVHNYTCCCSFTIFVFSEHC